MRKYEEEHYQYDKIKDKIYPWVKNELTDQQALNGKNFSEKDTPVIGFVGDLKIIFVIKRGEESYEVLKDAMLPPHARIWCVTWNLSLEIHGTADLELLRMAYMRQVLCAFAISGRCVLTN